MPHIPSRSCFVTRRPGGIVAIMAAAALLSLAAHPVLAESSVTLGGVTLVNHGLVGVGRLDAALRDKYGETFGSGSGMAIDPKSWTREGATWRGTIWLLPNIFALALAKHFGIALKPQPTGAYAATLTQTLTKQVDIGFSQAPFNLNAVEEGKIRIIAMGRDVPELRQMTSRLIIANTAILAEKKPLIARYMQAFLETLDWLYSDPAAIKAYAAWSGLPESIARRAPEFLTKQNLDPRHISGLDAIVADAVKFKYLPAPLSAAQLAEVIQVPVK